MSHSRRDWGNETPRLLKDPKTTMGQLCRRLAEVAMSVTHHDASDDEPGYIHEVEAMERKFSAILRGKLRLSPTSGEG